ncbi:MAG TPA: DUF2460 domain-containing protein [Pyrinomonadaceae bacterium]|nr:DUF2460 domain-containing protein [Pyrinomonadaceae bacterium]
MAFDNQVFPLSLSALTPRSGWSTTVVELGGGTEQRNVNWSDARRQYDAKLAENFALTDFIAVEKFFNARRGRGRSFPLRDRSSFRATAEALGTGDGSTTTFQLKVAGGDASNAYQREIYLPETGTYTIYDNGTPVVEGVGAGKFQLALTGATAGLVTFGTAPIAAHVLTATFDYYIPVRFDLDNFPDATLFIWTTGTTGLVKGPSIPLIEVRYASEF